MSNLSLSASVIALVLGAAACADQTQTPPEKNGGTLHGGVVKGSFTDNEVKLNRAGQLQNITLTARDVGGDGTIINSDTYKDLDHGFSLELPGGHYKLQFTDPAGHVLESYGDVVVDGDLMLAPQQAAE